MKKLIVLGLVLFAAAAPLAAGTVYLPVVDLDQPAGTVYKTRVWITNYGTAPATVQLLYLPGAGDGTSQRATPDTRAVAPGTTFVLFEAAGPGLLEVQAPDHVAVNGELRNVALAGPREVFGVLPVIGSQNVTGAGDTLVLQGLRRSRFGVRSHLGFMNLGHETASCAASLYGAGGDRLIGATGLPMAPLSHALVQDVLDLVQLQQIGDVHARISCDQPFSAYVALHEVSTGELVFLAPSTTGASTLAPPGEEAPPPPADPKSHVYTRSGTFHKATRGQPTAIFNIPAPKNRTFRRIVLDMDFKHGGWAAEDPAGNHSLFWLHRGACCWPTWEKNIVGFVNLFGPGKNFVKAIHNVDYEGTHEFDKVVNFTRGFQANPGETYHLRYDYDAARGTIRLALFRNGRLLREASGAATTSRIRSDPSGFFMAYFGHEPHRPGCNDCGPEVPTFGWEYSNLRVELIE